MTPEQKKLIDDLRCGRYGRNFTRNLNSGHEDKKGLSGFFQEIINFFRRIDQDIINLAQTDVAIPKRLIEKHAPGYIRYEGEWRNGKIVRINHLYTFSSLIADRVPHTVIANILEEHFEDIEQNPDHPKERDYAFFHYDKNQKTLQGTRLTADKLRMLFEQDGQGTKLEKHFKYLTPIEKNDIKGIVDNVTLKDCEFSMIYDSFENYWIATVFYEDHTRTLLGIGGKPVKQVLWM